MSKPMHPMVQEAVDAGRTMGGEKGVLIAALQWRLVHEGAHCSRCALRVAVRRGWVTMDDPPKLVPGKGVSLDSIHVTEIGEALAREVLPC